MFPLIGWTSAAIVAWPMPGRKRGKIALHPRIQ